MTVTVAQVEASNPDGLTQAGAQLERAAATVAGQISAQRANLEWLRAGWQGTARDAAIAKAEPTLTQLQRLHDSTQQLQSILTEGGGQLTQTRATIVATVAQLQRQGWQVAPNGVVSAQPGGPLDQYAKISPVNAMQVRQLAAANSVQLKTLLADFDTTDRHIDQRVRKAIAGLDAPAPGDRHGNGIQTVTGDRPKETGDQTPTQIASEANQAKLREERARTQADVDRMQPGFDELARKQYMGDHSTETADELWALLPQLTAAKKRLDEIDAVRDGLSKAPETYLAQLEIPHDYDQPVHAAIAVGNPDTATSVSVTVPGVGSTTKDSLPGMVTEARNLQQSAQKQLDRLGRPGSVATIAWMGYDPPANPLDTDSPTDLWRTMTDDRAQAGGSSLASYLQQIDANNPNAHVSLLGHSYGSLTASLALQQLHNEGVHAVDDAVFYGSPGLEITSQSQLGLAPGHAYVMQAPGDPITNFVAPTASAHGWGFNPYGPELSMPELSSYAGMSPDDVSRGGVSDHAGYPRATTGPDGQPVLNMSGYNLAVITAGIADLPGGGEQLVMAPTPLQPYPHQGG